jgi:hypothetical protein
MDLIAGTAGKALLSNERPSVELIANALLITAAPDLLYAAQVAYSLLLGAPGDRDTFTLGQLSKAIAKAEGRAP